MNECTCGASFKHASNLSRHQRGNYKQGVRPCIIFATHLTQKLVTAGELKLAEALTHQLEIYNERFMQKEEITEEVMAIEVESFDIDNPPSWVSAQPSVLEQATSGPFQPGKILEALYCSPDHPESWSVFWPNLKMDRVSLWQHGEWRSQDFETWSWDFIVFAILRYHKRDLEKMGQMYLHLKSPEGKKDLRSFRKELKNVLWGPIRNKIKKTPR